MLLQRECQKEFTWEFLSDFLVEALGKEKWIFLREFPCEFVEEITEEIWKFLGKLRKVYGEILGNGLI